MANDGREELPFPNQAEGDTLRGELEELEGLLDGFPVAEAHFISDLALYNFALDVLEQGRAVLLLVEQGVGRSAIANARAAYEASVDALLITSRPEGYDRLGARGRIWELIELREMRERMSAGHRKLGLEVPEEELPLEEMVRLESHAVDERGGPGDDLRRALEEVGPGTRARGHWSGMTRKGIEQRMEEEWGEEGLAEMLDFMRGLAAIHAHPRPRTGFRDRMVEAGTLYFTERPEDRATAVSLATGSTTTTRIALQYRLSDEFKART